jgi:molybdopterin-containing oxidoreductase family membrane subunit
MRKLKVRNLILVLSILFTLLGIFGAGYTLVFGLEQWGLTNKTVWGIAIVNFVFWIGNAHSGTLISAVLYLLRQEWRNSIHRIAETITIIAIIIAAFFPLLHLGRPWFFYWMLPIPNQTQLWANFKSPLIWDVFAIITYAVLSFLFWFVGIIPDYRHLKLLRTKNKNYSKFASIWSGSLFNWVEYRWTYHYFAGILTFVVISVHSIVSYDFSVSILPQWHSTMLPVFFVVGAIYSGIAFILFCTSIISSLSSFGDKIPEISKKNLAKLLLTFSLILLYFYIVELFFVFYSQNPVENFIFRLRFNQNFITIFILMVVLIFVLPHLFWSTRIANNQISHLLISSGVLLGMWLERYLLIIPVLSTDFITKTTERYTPTLIDLSLTFGSFGAFVLIFYVIGKAIPLVPKFES